MRTKMGVIAGMNVTPSATDLYLLMSLHGGR